jgi:hypothetical protein
LYIIFMFLLIYFVALHLNFIFTISVTEKKES